MDIRTILQRVRVVAKAAPTWLTALGVVVAVVAEQAAGLLPGQAETIGHVALIVAGWITAAVGIIRRVTPVLDSDYWGILPAEED